ncbi:MAG: LysM peptidoglycan-binding domain-containing protein [Spirochaetota bacterium]
MMRVLTEQHVSARRPSMRRSAGRPTERPSRRRKGRHIPPRTPSRGLGSGRAIAATLRTALLIVAIVALAATLIVVLPELEATSGADEPVIMHASAPGLPVSAAGVVRLELTEDVEHFVAEGETLSGIATEYGVGPGELAGYNGLDDPDTIVPGERIVIPGPDSRRDLTEEQ